ncbi:MAG: peroxiredoxin [bacterium]
MGKDKGVRILGIGDTLPEFSAQTTRGEIDFPEDYSGEWLIIISHPADFTPVCTSELVAYARRLNEFKDLNCSLVGLSTDDMQTHEEWLEAMGEKFEDVEISFPIIADASGEISRELGYLHPDNDEVTIRGTMIIDPSGKVRLSNFYPGEVGRSVAETLRALEALQVADKNEVVLPADWPQNNEVGGQVMETPGGAKSGNKFEGQLHGDWWFCHRHLEK